jgi:hypothetical protein
MSDGTRLVAVFDEPPEEPEAKREHLMQLIEGFSHTLTNPSTLPPASSVDLAFRRLDVALEALRARAGGVSTVLVDLHSPVLWGSSEPQRHADEVESLVHVGEALDQALKSGMALDEVFALDTDKLVERLTDLGAEPEHAGLLGRTMLQSNDPSALRHHLLTSLAVARVRHPGLKVVATRAVCHEPQFGYFVRSLASIYLLLVVFEGPFSELHVESAVVHALPTIEQLVLALPPFDPPPKAGRVIKLRG